MSAFFIFGCDAPPPTTPRDVSDYMRNADSGAQVRRLDEHAQRYVDRVLKAQADWVKACDPMDKISDLDALWKLDAKEWRDAAEVKKRLKIIENFRQGRNGQPAESVRDASDAEDRKQSAIETHSSLFKKLCEVIEEVPPGLRDEMPGLPGDARRLVRPGVGNPEDTRQERYVIADEYHALLVYVQTNADRFDPSGNGLTFTDPVVTDEAEHLSLKLKQRFLQDRDSEIESVESILADEPELRRAALEEKDTFRQRGISSEADRRKMRQLELLVQYYDARLKSAEKRKRKLDQKAEADSAQM